MGENTPISLAAAREAWLADGRFRRLSRRTLEEYERVSGLVLDFARTRLEGEPRLADLTPALARSWMSGRALQPASVAAYVRALRALSRWSGREYGVPEPLAGLRPPRVDPPPIAVFSAAELRRLLELAPPHLAYAITLLAESGLRVSEACAVELTDIDARWLQVRHGKGGRPRKVPVSALLARATGLYLTRIRPALVGPAVDRLLVNRRGRAWTRDSLRHALRRLGAQAAIAGVRVSPHTFRHQFAHDVAFGGGSLIVLRDVMGHRSVSMVERYAVPDDEARQALVRRRTPLGQRR